MTDVVGHCLSCTSHIVMEMSALELTLPTCLCLSTAGHAPRLFDSAPMEALAPSLATSVFGPISRPRPCMTARPAHVPWPELSVADGSGPLAVTLLTAQRCAQAVKSCYGSDETSRIDWPIPEVYCRAAVRVVRIAPNRAAAPRDSRFGQNERLGDSAIRRFGNS